MADTHDYEVALSFAGAQRDYVRAVARALKSSGVEVFYDEDEDESVRLWGLDLVEEFHRIYSKASSVVVMFISRDYAERMWTRHERRAALERALQERREYILPARFDNTELAGLSSTIRYLKLAELPPEAFAETIRRKLVSIGARLPSNGGATGEWLIEGANREAGVTRVRVSDRDGNPVAEARVAIVRPNETATFASTSPAGEAVLSLPGRELVSVWVAHAEHDALLIGDHDSGDDLSVQLTSPKGVSSVIFESSTGYLPGVGGRIAPIANGKGYYFYGDNIAADGQAARPAPVTPGLPIGIEDATGTRRILTFVAIVGNQSLLKVERGEGSRSRTGE